LEQQNQPAAVFTDLGLSKELEDRNFRNQFFRTEREIDIPAQLKRLRKMRRMRQEELAERVGTKQSAISRIERSQEAKYELETLVRMAEALDARLSVVIEPYEDVIARYQAQERTLNGLSAADAQSEAKQPENEESAASWKPGNNWRPVTLGSMSEKHGISRD
jgi:transcriptional regulator with XRE-family HTH domain